MGVAGVCCSICCTGQLIPLCPSLSWSVLSSPAQKRIRWITYPNESFPCSRTLLLIQTSRQASGYARYALRQVACCAESEVREVRILLQASSPACNCCA